MRAKRMQALEEYRAYAALYNEEPLMTEFAGHIERHYAKI